MTLGSFGNFQGQIKQVGRLEGSNIVNRQAFASNNLSGIHTPVGMGNRVNLFITYSFSDLSIFTDPNFKFFGLHIGWSLANFDTNNTNSPKLVRAPENDIQLQGGTDPFSFGVYNEPSVTFEDNPELPSDHKAAKMDYSVFEFPFSSGSRTSTDHKFRRNLFIKVSPEGYPGDLFAYLNKAKRHPKWLFVVNTLGSFLYRTVLGQRRMRNAVEF